MNEDRRLIEDYLPIEAIGKGNKKQSLGRTNAAKFVERLGRVFERRGQQRVGATMPQGHLTPVAYPWTRTVRCKNPTCGATVPLVRQTWLCKLRDFTERGEDEKLGLPDDASLPVRDLPVRARTQMGAEAGAPAVPPSSTRYTAFCDSWSTSPASSTGSSTRRPA
jgi:hypothetical protein